jgi:hypothetical protein
MKTFNCAHKCLHCWHSKCYIFIYYKIKALQIKQYKSNRMFCGFPWFLSQGFEFMLFWLFFMLFYPYHAVPAWVNRKRYTYKMLLCLHVCFFLWIFYKIYPWLSFLSCTLRWSITNIYRMFHLKSITQKPDLLQSVRFFEYVTILIKNDQLHIG